MRLNKIMSKSKNTSVTGRNVPNNGFFDRIIEIIDAARTRIHRAVDCEMVRANWLIGREIINEEQQGNKRALYGERIIEGLAARLTDKYGTGWSASHLWHVRQFYMIYKDKFSGLLRLKKLKTKELILHTPRAELSWSHYRVLMRVEKQHARDFYEAESAANNWSARELERQINSLLYERILLSRDKKGIIKMSKKGQEINSYMDMIKDPYVLEFTGLRKNEKLYESRLEQALIDNLSDFMLELGKGFTFAARQKRITLDGEHFYIDLVFYNTILKCFVVVDLKIGKLTHQDIGQMQMYVNYYDRALKQSDDNPTVGIILCGDKKNAVVKYTLAENNKQIFASKYKLYLPTEEELKRELEREKEDFLLKEETAKYGNTGIDFHDKNNAGQVCRD